MILFLFNQRNKYTIQEISEGMGVKAEELKAVLMKLCNPKLKLLIYKNKKPEFKPEEDLELNMEFSNNNKRIPFVPQPTPQQIAVSGIDGKSHKEIEEDQLKQQQFVIQANIVRVMKARKTYKHNDLLQEVIAQCRMFKAQPKMIKQCIEKLIELEYLKRDEEDRSKYIYLP